jgi:hypothetical protein
VLLQPAIGSSDRHHHRFIPLSIMTAAVANRLADGTRVSGAPERESETTMGSSKENL